MENPFLYSSDNKRYQTLAYYFRREFGRRVFKVPVELGCTCPNRDGTKGQGGCTYCMAGGGGSAPGAGELPFAEQYDRGTEALRRKWPDGVSVVYFQSYTNTHLPPERLRERLEEALTMPGAVGISVATRADALPNPVLDELEAIARRTWLCVELGLQTAHDRTAERINRCHSYREFLEGYRALRERGLRVCVHLIDGLPGESREEMVESARRVGELRPHSVKFHMLHLLRGTAMAAEYEREPFPLLSREQYVSLLCEQMEWLPPETVIQRVTGDPPADRLIAPAWTRDKLRVRNALDIEMARRDTVQGARFSAGSSV